MKVRIARFTCGPPGPSTRDPPRAPPTFRTFQFGKMVGRSLAALVAGTITDRFEPKFGKMVTGRTVHGQKYRNTEIITVRVLDEAQHCGEALLTLEIMYRSRIAVSYDGAGF